MPAWPAPERPRPAQTMDIQRRVEEVQGLDADFLPESVLSSTRPLLLRGLVSAWPAVRQARRSNAELVSYLGGYYRGKPVSTFVGAPEIKGRFFYNADLTGFNFFQADSNLNQVLRKLLEHCDDRHTPAFYIGATAVDGWLPGFRADNDMNLDADDALVSIWIGNRSRVAAHFDFPNNIACCVAGRRRFTLFPPAEIRNLYVGPLDLTPAGQQISLVDFAEPDFAAHPRFAKALESALVAELAPGDAIFIPGMWWHHVEALDAVNVLVNYWFSPTPDFLGSPADALTHALMAIKALSEEQRQAWLEHFKYYVFDGRRDRFDHIPEPARGRLGEMDERTARSLRAELLNQLNR